MGILKNKDLPKWLDKIIYNDFKAIFEPHPQNVVYNPDQPYEFVQIYLGTYFPRSYAEAFCIVNNLLENSNYLSSIYALEEVNILDFCCGTGGELIGLLSALDKYFHDGKNINVIVCDGNEKALDYLHKIIDKAASLSRHKYRFVSIHKEIKNFDDVDKLDFPSCSFDIELCDKVCCEFISHGVNKKSYEYLASFLSKKLSKDGLLVMLDVTTKCEGTMMFYPQMMNLQINKFVRESSEIETLLPLSCATYKDCRIPCFTQQTFRVTHMQKKDDESRVSYRMLCHKGFKEYLMSNNFTKSKTHIINPIRYQQNVEGAYCNNSKGNKDFIDSFNINI